MFHAPTPLKLGDTVLLIDERIEAGLVLPAYDYTLKCSHLFNLLDARGAIGVNQRAEYIKRVRGLARACVGGYLESLASEESRDDV